MIYYDNKYLKKDIKKSIHYLKESSSFNNKNAKNLLGIIYKNCDGVERNIANAIIYFNEAIQQGNDSYSMYNLARIYYFGIEEERDISKSIDLLINAAKNHLLLADLFLYYIFSNCNEKEYIDQKKKLHPNLLKLLQKFYLNEFYTMHHKLHQFFKDYDLYLLKDYIFDANYYLKNGNFYENDLKNQIDKLNALNKLLRKDIDDDFYEGFYLEN